MLNAPPIRRWRRDLLVFPAMLIVLAATAGALFNSLRPNGLRWDGMGIAALDARREAAVRLAGVRYVSEPGLVQEMYVNGEASFVDARTAERYASGHLPGAVSLPAAALARPAMETRVHTHVLPLLPVVVYCRHAECPSGNRVARYLKQRGFTDLQVYTGGWASLVAAGLPEEAGPWLD